MSELLLEMFPSDD